MKFSFFELFIVFDFDFDFVAFSIKHNDHLFEGSQFFKNYNFIRILYRHFQFNKIEILKCRFHFFSPETISEKNCVFGNA